jgi:hypothetical protein
MNTPPGGPTAHATQAIRAAGTKTGHAASTTEPMDTSRGPLPPSCQTGREAHGLPVAGATHFPAANPNLKAKDPMPPGQTLPLANFGSEPMRMTSADPSPCAPPAPGTQDSPGAGPLPGGQPQQGTQIPDAAGFTPPLTTPSPGTQSERVSGPSSRPQVEPGTHYDVGAGPLPCAQTSSGVQIAGGAGTQTSQASWQLTPRGNVPGLPPAPTKTISEPIPDLSAHRSTRAQPRTRSPLRGRHGYQASRGLYAPHAHIVRAPAPPPPEAPPAVPTHGAPGFGHLFPATLRNRMPICRASPGSEPPTATPGLKPKAATP